MKKILILLFLLAVSVSLFAERSRTERRRFMRTHPCPSTGKTVGACPGYVVDHIIPLQCCGPDKASNMQWQSVAEGKKKDRAEGKCSQYPVPYNKHCRVAKE